MGYDRTGFWIQNSWGKAWGHGGFGHVTYDDWLAYGTDVWVARLGAPVHLADPSSTAVMRAGAPATADAYTSCALRPHIVALGNDGLLRTGVYGTTAESLQEIVTRDLPALTKDWKRKRLLLYAHGGLVDERAAVQRLADLRPALLASEIYPLSFIWKTDYWTTLRNVLGDAVKKIRPEGALGAVGDFMLDRLDDALEPIARAVTGKLVWDEMKENALDSSADGGGAALAADLAAAWAKATPDSEIHLVAHSAGSILFAPLLSRLAQRGVTVTSCSLWAPACTMALFQKHYAPALQSGALEALHLFTLTDAAEQDDDCAGIYNKSLLYLVSNAFEAEPRIPLLRDGVPLLGMAKFVQVDPLLTSLIAAGKVRWIQAPNQGAAAPGVASGARHHGDFDDDDATLRSTLAIMLGTAGARTAARAPIHLHSSLASRQARRRRVLALP